MSTETNTLALKAQQSPWDRALMERLWHTVCRLVYRLANAYMANSDPERRRLFDTGDLVQSGYLALCDAVRGYNPGRGGFTTLLVYHIRKQFAVVSGNRSSKRRPEDFAISLDSQVSNETETTHSDQLADPAAEFESDVLERESNKQDVAALMKEIDKLTGSQRHALMLTSWDGLSFREAARVMSVSEGQVRKLRNQASAAVHRTKAAAAVARGYHVRHVSLKEYKLTRTSMQEKFLLWKERTENIHADEGR